MRGSLVERLRPFALVAFGASCVVSLALVVPAIYVPRLFHRVLTSGSMLALAILIGIALLAAVLAYAADLARLGALASASAAIDRRVVDAATANSPGDLRDTELLRSFLGSGGMRALVDVPCVLLYLLAMAWIHPLLGLGASIAIAMVFGLTMTTRLPKSARRPGQAEELVRSAESLVVMGMPQSALAAWRERHEHFVSRRQHGAFARTASLALQIGMLALGTWLVIDSQLSIGPMIAAAFLLWRALLPFEQLVASWPAIVAAHAAWRRLNRRATSIAATGMNTPIPAGRIELDRVCYAPSAGQPLSIKNVTLSVTPGESILIVGPSGSGKTTLARLLLGVLRPNTGTVRLDSADVARWDRAALGQRVGYVPQEIHLFPGTVADNIARLGTLDSTRVVQAARFAHAHEMIVRMSEGYHTEVCGGGRRLTASQWRRIALARALYVNPRLVVLDEPDADLDAQGELALVKTLAELKERGVTVVIVGQRTSLLEHVDRMAFLRDGTLQLVPRIELDPRSNAAVVAMDRPGMQPRSLFVD